MKVRFWGTRGSLAKPGKDTVRYGGNTACVEVLTDCGTLIVLDCGTGGHELGAALMRQGRAGVGHMLISHTHWDHIQGIPFFTPFFVPGNRWTLYAPQGFGDSLRDTLAGQMEYTYFPVTPEAFGAQVRYAHLGEGTFQIGDAVIHTRYLNHPALTLAFRIEADGASVIYSSDHEPHLRAAAAGDTPLTGEDLEHARFMDGADLLIHDAQYLFSEYELKIGWGHSTIEYTMQVARTAGVAKLALIHHDPFRSDDQIDAIVADLRQRDNGGLELFGAAEGQTVELTGDRAPTLTDDACDTALRTGAAADTRLILLATADDLVTDKVARALANEPLELHRVATGAAARAVLAEQLPAMLLIDHALPDMPVEAVIAGVDATRTGQLPAIRLGGGDEPEEGLTGVLADPWSVEYARTRIRTWLLRAECQWELPAIPDDEGARLAAVHGLGLLDTPREERFDRYTRLAAGMFRAPIALISLVDAERQWFKSCHGTDICEGPREQSFCAHAIAGRGMLVVPDALQDARFRDNPLVSDGPRIRFYAGALLHSPGGQAVGTLCVLDVRPRNLDDEERRLLGDMAALVEEELTRRITDPVHAAPLARAAG